MIDENRKYTIQEIVNEGLIQTPMGSDKYWTQYTYVNRKVRDGSLKAERVGNGLRGEYKIKGKDIIEFLENK